MPQLIKPGEVKVITKDGEVKISISLDLNINLGEISGGVNILGATGDKTNKKEEDKVQWAIPDFAPTEKINFGK